MNNIRVENLDPDVTEEEIRAIFIPHGPVERFKMVIDRETGLLSGSAFLEMTNDREAETAILALDGSNFKGKVLKVRQARPQLHRGTSAK